MWKRFVKDYLSFSSSDRNGLIVLSFLIFLVILISVLAPFFTFGKRQFDPGAFKEDVLKFYSQLLIEKEEFMYADIELFHFDPNQLTMPQMEKLGINKRLAGTIENYLAKGGRFREANDMMKIYGMTDSLFARLSPFILIEKEPAGAVTGKDDATISQSLLIELNLADTNDLKKLPGIGSVLSSRIIKYRELLGGYYDPSQLSEVYGISDSLYASIAPFLITDTTQIQTLLINQATFSQILRHPYISYQQAAGLSALIRNHGEIHDFELLLIEEVFDSVVFKKLRPYLSLEVK